MTKDERRKIQALCAELVDQGNYAHGQIRIDSSRKEYHRGRMDACNYILQHVRLLLPDLDDEPGDLMNGDIDFDEGVEFDVNLLAEIGQERVYLSRWSIHPTRVKPGGKSRTVTQSEFQQALMARRRAFHADHGEIRKRVNTAHIAHPEYQRGPHYEFCFTTIRDSGARTWLYPWATARVGVDPDVVGLDPPTSAIEVDKEAFRRVMKSRQSRRRQDPTTMQLCREANNRVTKLQRGQHQIASATGMESRRAQRSAEWRAKQIAAAATGGQVPTAKRPYQPKPKPKPKPEPLPSDEGLTAIELALKNAPKQPLKPAPARKLVLSKVCRRCGKDKLPGLFYTSQTTDDRLWDECIACEYEIRKEQRKLGVIQ